jgi:hypothetical protein
MVSGRLEVEKPSRRRHVAQEIVDRNPDAGRDAETHDVGPDRLACWPSACKWA